MALPFGGVQQGEKLYCKACNTSPSNADSHKAAVLGLSASLTGGAAGAGTGGCLGLWAGVGFGGVLIVLGIILCGGIFTAPIGVPCILMGLAMPFILPVIGGMSGMGLGAGAGLGAGGLVGAATAAKGKQVTPTGKLETESSGDSLSAATRPLEEAPPAHDIQESASEPDPSPAVSVADESPAKSCAPVGSDVQTLIPAPQPSIPDQIRRLAELRDSGILTEDEFTAKKTQLLDKM